MEPKHINSYVIAEVGQAHDGSLGNAHAFIDLAKACGAHAIKFQMHFADVESGPEESWRVNFSYQDTSRYDYWKRIEFTADQWLNLKKHCDDIGLDFVCSAFSQAAAELLVKMQVDTFKVASGEIDNYLFLDFLAEHAGHVILSTGMSDMEEIREAHFRLQKKVKTSILQCTTKYPASLSDIGLNNIKLIASECRPDQVGLSDHSGLVTPAIYAHAYGATIFEHHICFHKSQFGPDTSSSLDPTQFRALVTGLEQCDELAKRDVLKDKTNFIENRIRFGKTLIFKRTLAEGHIITSDDLETRKPAALGLHPSKYKQVLGQKLKKGVKAGDFVTYELVEEM